MGSGRGVRVRRFQVIALAVLPGFLTACEPEEERAPLDCEGASEVALADVFQQVQGPVCSGCHTGAGQAPDQSSEDAVAALVGAESIAYRPLRLIVPGDPAASVLYLKVSGGSPNGFHGPDGENVGGRMPPGQTLSAEKRELLRGWICSGAGG